MRRWTSEEVLEGFHSIPVHRTLVIMTLTVCVTAVIVSWVVSNGLSTVSAKQDLFVVQNHISKGGGVIIVNASLDSATLCHPEYIDTMKRFDLVCDVPTTISPIPLDFTDQSIVPATGFD